MSRRSWCKYLLALPVLGAAFEFSLFQVRVGSIALDVTSAELGAAAGLGLLVLFIAADRKHELLVSRRYRWLWVLTTLCLLSFFVSSLLSPYRTLAFKGFVRLLLGYVALWAGIAVFHGQEDAKGWLARIVWSLGLVMVVIGMIAVASGAFPGGGGIREWLATHFTCGEMHRGPGGQLVEYRPSATLVNPNLLAWFMVLSLVLNLRFLQRKELGRLGFLCVSGLFVACLVFTQTRGTWLAFAATMVACILLFRQKAVRLGVVYHILAFVLLVCLFTPVRVGLKAPGPRRAPSQVATPLPGSEERGTPAAPGGEYPDLRIMLWKAALKAWGERKLIGLGPNVFPTASIDYLPGEELKERLAPYVGRLGTHNVAVEVLVGGGLLGVVAVAALCIYALRALITVDNPLADKVLILPSALIMLDNLIYNYFFIVVSAFILALAIAGSSTLVGDGNAKPCGAKEVKAAHAE